MCCVCERSCAASISSRMYIGTGLNCSSAMISDQRPLYMHMGLRYERAVRKMMMRWAYRWPPLSSVRLCFHTLPSWTLILRLYIKSWLSGGCSFATLPGRSSPKIPPKSLDSHQIRYSAGILLCATHPFTFSHVVFKASRLYRSSSSIVCSIFSLSLNTVPSIFFRLASRFSKQWEIIQISPNNQWVDREPARTCQSCSRLWGSPSSCLVDVPRARVPIPQLAHVRLAEVILRSRLAKQTVATRPHPPSQ